MARSSHPSARGGRSIPASCPRTTSRRSSYIPRMLIVRTWGRSSRLGRSARLGLAGVLVLASVAASSGTASAAQSRSFTVDLGRRSDYVAQTNNVQCVGASTQMMLNMIRPGADRTASTQLRLQKVARAWSGPRPDGRIRRGAGVQGWAVGLTLAGAGPYRVVGLPTIDDALLVAARAMKATGRPVGLLMWHGRHAWVMSGFEATADPFAGGARVTAAIVEDPLYPHGSTAWGPSPAPGAKLSVRTVARQFVPRVSSWGKPSLAGTYVLVLPYEFDARTLRLASRPRVGAPRARLIERDMARFGHGRQPSRRRQP